jgi:hypothetical protein
LLEICVRAATQCTEQLTLSQATLLIAERAPNEIAVGGGGEHLYALPPGLGT